MTIEDFNKLPLGVYKISWGKESGGGYSFGTIGQLYNGERWIACSNWTSPKTEGIATNNGNIIELIRKVKLIASK